MPVLNANATALNSYVEFTKITQVRFQSTHTHVYFPLTRTAEMLHKINSTSIISGLETLPSAADEQGEAEGRRNPWLPSLSFSFGGTISVE